MKGAKSEACTRVLLVFKNIFSQKILLQIYQQLISLALSVAQKRLLKTISLKTYD